MTTFGKMFCTNSFHVATLLAFAISALPARSEEFHLRVVQRYIQVRSEPTVLAEAIATLEEGDELTAERKQGEWYQVTVADGRTGYLYIGAVEVLDTSAPVESDEESPEPKQPVESPTALESQASMVVGPDGAVLYNKEGRSVGYYSPGVEVSVVRSETGFRWIRTPDGREYKVVAGDLMEKPPPSVAPPAKAPEEVVEPPLSEEHAEPSSPLPERVVPAAVVPTSQPLDVKSQKALLTDIMTEKELKYVDSRLELDLATSAEEDTSSTAKSVGFNTQVGIDLEVEKPKTGYWIAGALELDLDWREDEETTDGRSTETYRAATIRVKGFNEWGWDDLLRVGHKWYLTPQSPYFFYVEGQGKYYKTKTKTEDDQGETETESEADPVTNGAAGLGYGRVVDIGAYERIIVVQNELLAAGVLKQRLSRRVIGDLLPLYQRSMDHYDRMIQTQEILVAENLINAEDITLDISYEIYDAIQSSFDKRRYGLELRLSYFQELTKEDSHYDKYGYADFYIRWEYPISRSRQFSLEGDLSHQISGGKDDTQYSAQAEMSSVRGRYIRSKTGFRYDGRDGIVKEWSSTAYAELTYKVTDVVSWENTLEYNWYDDESTKFSFTSKLVYQLY